MSIKDALKKAGFSSAKEENERKQKLKKEKTKVEKHQERRNFCEVCEFIQPDVERFKHNNPRVDAQWICSNCADKSEILDEFRKTEQSDSCLNNRYRRYYGPTNHPGFSREPVTAQRDNRKNPNYKHDRNKNRNAGNQGKDNKPKRNDRSGNKFVVDEDGEKNFNC